MIWLSLQLLTGALMPPTATVLSDCVAPKPLPSTVMTVAGSPVVGDRLVITGGGATVNGTAEKTRLARVQKQRDGASLHRGQKRIGHQFLGLVIHLRRPGLQTRLAR